MAFPMHIDTMAFTAHYTIVFNFLNFFNFLNSLLYLFIKNPFFRRILP